MGVVWDVRGVVRDQMGKFTVLRGQVLCTYSGTGPHTPGKYNFGPTP